MLCPKCHSMEIFDRTHYYSCGRISVPIDGCFLCGYMTFREYMPVMKEVPDAGHWSSPEARARNTATAVENGKRNGGKNKIPVVHIPAERKAKLLAALAKIDGEILERRGEA